MTLMWSLVYVSQLLLVDLATNWSKDEYPVCRGLRSVSLSLHDDEYVKFFPDPPLEYQVRYFVTWTFLCFHFFLLGVPLDKLNLSFLSKMGPRFFFSAAALCPTPQQPLDGRDASFPHCVQEVSLRCPLWEHFRAEERQGRRNKSQMLDQFFPLRDKSLLLPFFIFMLVLVFISRVYIDQTGAVEKQILDCLGGLGPSLQLHWHVKKKREMDLESKLRVRIGCLCKCRLHGRINRKSLEQGALGRIFG